MGSILTSVSQIEGSYGVIVLQGTIAVYYFVALVQFARPKHNNHMDIFLAGAGRGFVKTYLKLFTYGFVHFTNKTPYTSCSFYK